VNSGHESITALILAAGASSRMGSPKALLMYRGETFLDRLIGFCGEACGSVVVVLGRHAIEIRAAIRKDATFVLNPDPDRGQLSSLQCGLAQISGAAMFVPVDVPAVEPATVLKLVAAFQSSDCLVVVPAFAGKHGHPVCIASPVVKELLAMPATGQARDIIRRYRAQTLYVAVEDPGVLRDIDTRTEYQDLLMEPPR
jgi:molybdenum cofactor cytidylyltransferase